MKRNGQHRAVAPIIATLIMVAIAVVGGVMVYVFTQGFFTGTQTQAPTTDAVSMTGYDAREIAAATGVTDHLGVAVATQGDATVGDGKVAGEEIAVHIKNLGTSAITLNKVEANFVSLTIDTSVAVTLTAGEYALLTGNPAIIGSSIPANSEATLIISISGATVPAGNAIPIQITTGSGSEFSYNVIVGQRE